MTGPTVSVIVVSRGRPDALRRCLDGLAQLYFDRFEVVIVADPAGLATASGYPDMRTVAFDRPNISQARNAGLGVAGGDIVAFIDDDAVPEPTWLTHLVHPFADPDVAAAGGFVLGRNGISFQWRAREVDATGVATPVAVPGDAAFLPDPSPGGAIKLEGTNMALRRGIALDLGGFDPAFAFYLDDTDLALRLARAGHRTALVPLAQVHHGFAPSERRRADRVPRELFDIGASSAVFWRKHTDPEAVPAARASLIAQQRARLLRHMVVGTLEPRDVRRLMASLCAGLEDGAIRVSGTCPPGTAVPEFRPLANRPTRAHLLWGTPGQSDTLRARARALRADNRIVTLMLLSRTALYHRVTFSPDGVWEQSGGSYGRSVREGALFRAIPPGRRTRIEAERIRKLRTIGGYESD